MTDELNLVVLINPMVIYDGKFHFLSKTLEEGSHAPRSWQDEKTSFSKVTIYSSQKPAKAWPQRQFFLSCCQENQHFGFCDMKIWHKSWGLVYSVECRNTIYPLNVMWTSWKKAKHGMPVCSWISRPQWWLLSFKKKLYVCWKGHAEIVCTPVCLKSSSRMLLFFVVLLPTVQRIGWHFPVCLINCHLLERVICVIHVYLILIYLVDQVIHPSEN